MRMIAAAYLLCLTTSTLFAQPDFSSPKAAFKSYTQALAAGDTDALKNVCISTDKQFKMLAGMAAYSQVEKKFRDTLIKAFPETAKELPDPAAETLKSIDTATVKIDGESATLITSQNVEPVKLKRIDGNWKVDFTSMYNDESVSDIILFRTALSTVMADMTTEIEAGKYKTYADVKNTLEMKVKMHIALPPDDVPTTKPGN